MARSTELRQALKERFYPFAEQRGFVRAKSPRSLLTVFRRRRGTTLHVFDVQWDKYHQPRFVINFGEAPGEGVDVAGTHVGAAEIEPSHCTSCGRLQRRRGGSMGCWFQLRKPYLEALRSRSLRYSPVEVVDEVIRAFAELEGWWETKDEGRHVYIWRWRMESQR